MSSPIRNALDHRVALLIVELAEILELEQELSRPARHALLAVCGDMAAALERSRSRGEKPARFTGPLFGSRE